jgi:hypothetical protein
VSNFESGLLGSSLPHPPAHAPARTGGEEEDTHPLLASGERGVQQAPNTVVYAVRLPRGLRIPPRLVSLGQAFGWSRPESVRRGHAGDPCALWSRGERSWGDAHDERERLCLTAGGALRSGARTIGGWLLAALVGLCHSRDMDPPPTQDEVWGEAGVLLKLAVPVSATTVCRLAIFATDAAFVGQLGTTQMAAAALAQVCQSMSLVFIYGTAVALNTLCAQAVGAGNGHLAGLWLQLALVLLAAISAVVILAFFCTQQLLEAFLTDICFDASSVATQCAHELWAGSEPVALAPGCICHLAGAWSVRLLLISYRVLFIAYWVLFVACCMLRNPRTAP